MRQIHFTTTNNIAEYEALLHGIHIAKNIGIRRLMCFSDSDLVAQRVSDLVLDELSKLFKGFEVQHIPRT